MTTKTKKITRATIKSFIKKNQGSLFVRVDSVFDGMQDMVDNVQNPQFRAAQDTTRILEHTLGLQGVYLVGSSRDSFERYEDTEYIGYLYWNCCGGGVVAIKK